MLKITFILLSSLFLFNFAYAEDLTPEQVTVIKEMKDEIRKLEINRADQYIDIQPELSKLKEAHKKAKDKADHKYKEVKVIAKKLEKLSKEGKKNSQEFNSALEEFKTAERVYKSAKNVQTSYENNIDKTLEVFENFDKQVEQLKDKISKIENKGDGGRGAKCGPNSKCLIDVDHTVKVKCEISADKRIAYCKGKKYVLLKKNIGQKNAEDILELSDDVEAVTAQTTRRGPKGDGGRGAKEGDGGHGSKPGGGVGAKTIQ